MLVSMVASLSAATFLPTRLLPESSFVRAVVRSVSLRLLTLLVSLLFRPHLDKKLTKW